MGGGWNRRTPAGAVKCDCAFRRLAWAKLDWRRRRQLLRPALLRGGRRGRW